MSTSTPTAAFAAARADAERRERRLRMRRRLPLLPGLVFLIVVTQIPFVVTIFISFMKWNLMKPKDVRFGTLKNYTTVLADPRMRAAILNTVVMVVGSVGIALIIGTGLALLLNRKFPGRGIVRTLLITPFLIMPVAASLMWRHLIYNPVYGLLNGTLNAIGKLFGLTAPQPEWVSSAPMVAVIIALVWTWTPFMMLITLAGLQSQTLDIVEAAKVDGAGTFQTFRYITLPHLRRYLELAIVLGIIYLLNTYDQVFTITAGGPGTATTNLPYEIYLTAFRKYDYGEAAAAGVLVVILSTIVATFGLRLLTSLADTTQPAKTKKEGKK
ncbi:MAG: sugar ABC transporter permease [Propionibacteriaceae bacterium]|jgi:sorbitol/mannitol transport system permease protein|nr:sugar ABC transporter permease [Propionibacteriaceae bacterium]